MSDNITPYNDKNEAHGHWVIHHGNNTLSFKVYYQNSEEVGYCESYSVAGKLTEKIFFLR